MLLKLSVNNYALIKNLDLDLDNGLTIITGETGAGKSILLGALSLILGSRADSTVLLDNKNKCIVEGIFRIEDYDLEEFFRKHDLDFDNPVVLRREINQAGKSRAFINDTPVTLGVLKELGDRLIDIHSQHQTLMLNDNSFQLNIIDSFAGTTALLNEYRTAYYSYKKLQKEYVELKEKADKSKSDLEYFQFYLAQLEEAKLENGEQEELEKEQELLEHAEEIKESLLLITRLFSDEDRSIMSLLREVKSNLGKIGDYLPGELDFQGRVESVLIELEDINAETGKLERNTEADPGRLLEINQRLDTIYSLIRKHRVNNLTDLINKREEIRAEINSIVTDDERLAEIESETEQAFGVMAVIAAKLSAKRSESITALENEVTELLKQLGMPNARFKILLSPAKDYMPAGNDVADFLFSANKQVEPENISKIASGGELSRVMLSLKSLVTKNKNMPTIIFDEIDSGVSGEVADKVGQILSRMGRYMQVVNITHLPQVASRGKAHYHVFKEEAADSTITRVKLLSREERIKEVARLLSGSEITETAVKNAEELIKAGAK